MAGIKRAETNLWWEHKCECECVRESDSRKNHLILNGSDCLRIKSIMSVKQTPESAFNLQVIKEYGPSLFAIERSFSFIQSFVCLFLHFVCHFFLLSRDAMGKSHFYLFIFGLWIESKWIQRHRIREHYWKIGLDESERDCDCFFFHFIENWFSNVSRL